MTDLNEFQALTEEINFRPLMLNKKAIDGMINIPNFHSIGIYVVSAKTRGISSPSITTLRYVLFDTNKKPIIIDGTSSKNIDTKKLKEAGYEKNKDFSNTSFVIQKKDLNDISNKLSKKYSYCIFGIERSLDKQDYKIFFEIIETWHGGGGGPGQGVAVSPAN